MQINEMTIEEVEARLAEITSEVETRSGEELETMKAEVVELQARKAELEEIEKRNADAKALNDDVVEPEKIIETRKEEKEMTNLEVRDSFEYGKAFVNAIISGDDTEARALLTENVSGTIPVPTLLDNEIRNAWEDCQIMSLVKRTAYAGNVKVGFEYSADGANIHVEGQAAPEEENLVLGTVELKAESIKKWITVSDEAIEGTTVDTLGYIYKELAQKIVEKAEAIMIGKIVAAPAATTTTAPAVPVLANVAPAEDTIVMAEALLSGKARNLHIAMNRQTYAALTSVALKAKYAVDVFDGLKDKVVFTDALPAYSAASTDDTYIIIGDFGYGAQANFPSGNDMSIKVDDLSLAEKDLVKVVGRQYVGMGVVAPKAFVKVTK